MSPFSIFLRQIRIKHGYRQKELAELLGYEPSYVSALERCKKGLPKKDFVNRLITKLELDEAELEELNQAVAKSRRQILLPLNASQDEYELLSELESQLGHLNPLQVQLMRLALTLPNSTVSNFASFHSSVEQRSAR